jgi:hypothetical protein
VKAAKPPGEIKIVKGQATCEEASAVVATYLREAPNKAQGSGGFLDVGIWTCHDGFSLYPVLIDCENGGERFQVIAKHPQATSPPPVLPQTTTKTTTTTTTAQAPAPGSYTDCGPVSLGGTGPGVPDVQVSGVDCATAVQGVKQTGGSGPPGYHLCGHNPPPNPPYPGDAYWDDYCSGGARVLKMAE